MILERDGERAVVVQCKHWQKWKVGVRTVREFLGAMTAEKIQHGILVTMRGYTDDAIGFARIYGIELVAKEGLISLLKSLGHQTDREFLHLLTDKRKFCPKCDIEMVLRTSKTGSDAATQFWGCSAFPECRFTFSIK